MLKKEGAQLIGGNMFGRTPRELATEFGVSRQLRPGLNKAVAHVSLSLAPGEHLGDQEWCELAEGYLRKMGFLSEAQAPAQWVIARHSDTAHEHCHIVASRVRLDGGVVNDAHDYARNDAALRQLEEEYCLQTVPSIREFDARCPAGPRVKRAELELAERLAAQTGEGVLPPKLVIAAAIDRAIDTGDGTVEDLAGRLSEAGVEVRGRPGAGGELSGLSYGLMDWPGGMQRAFQGNRIGRDYGYRRLRERLAERERQLEWEARRVASAGRGAAAAARHGEAGGVERGPGSSAGAGERPAAAAGDLDERLGKVAAALGGNRAVDRPAASAGGGLKPGVGSVEHAHGAGRGDEGAEPEIAKLADGTEPPGRARRTRPEPERDWGMEL
ncbi:relaxase/mobilization nuclease domain-containing protein [Gloeobacter morelensis]|uniref:relaxase/mobilization nuclease domain-containing protein n=1 Tax=Gloeobacter morelensis TaxID=2907343 RepID=UPI001E3688E8|nr:relaxase/mobilization nuclease domain-containing protein [Gloeobacter morelensis MG652769]